MSRKEQILTIAAQLFHRRGYRGTTLQDIATELGMEAPSLYNHILSKDQLLGDLLIPLGESFVNGIHTIDQSSLSIKDKLKRVITLHVQLSMRHPDTMALSLNEWIYLKEADRNQFIKLRSEYEQVFYGWIREGIDAEIIKDIPHRLIGFTLLSTLRSTYAWIQKNPDLNPIEFEHYLTQLLLEGVLHQ